MEEKEREKHEFAVLLVYAFSGCILYAPWPEIEPTAVAYLDDALIN